MKTLLCHLASLFLALFASETPAQHVSLTLPIYGDGPAGAKAYQSSVAADGSVTVVAAVGGVPHSLRMFRYEPGGAVRWQVTLPDECTSWTDSSSNDEPYVHVRTFSDGDALVALNDFFDTSCVARFAAADGHLVWSNLEGPCTEYHQVLLDEHGSVTTCGVTFNGQDLVTRVARLDGADGDIQWTHLGSPQPACAGLLLSTNGDVAFLHALFNEPAAGVSTLSADGAVKWSRPLLDWGEYFLAFSADSQGNISVISADPTSLGNTVVLQTLAVSDGSVIGNLELDPEIVHAYPRDSGLIATAAHAAGRAEFSLLDPADGSVQWTTSPDPDLQCTLLPEYSNDILLLCYRDGGGPMELIRINEDSGSVVTNTSINDLPDIAHQQITVADETVHFIGLSNVHGDHSNEELRVAAVSVHTGQTTWSAGDPLTSRLPFYSPDDSFDGHHTTLLPSRSGAPGLILAGGNNDSGNVSAVYDYAPRVVKIAQHDGHEIWSWPPRGTVQGWTGHLSELAIASNGDVFVSGDKDLEQGSIAIVAKLNGVTGSPQWQMTGPVQPNSTYESVATDANGDVLVTGSWSTLQYTAKYAGSNGSLLWSAEMQNAIVGGDVHVVVDADNNVVAAGRYPPQSSSSFGGVQLAKYRGTDGVVLWTRRIEATGSGRLNEITVLPDGDPVVSSTGSLLRLDSLTGDPVWQRDDIQAWVVYLDSAQRLWTGGQVGSSSENLAANIQRIDPLTGETLWAWTSTEQTWLRVKDLSGGDNGNLVAALAPAYHGPFSFGTVSVETATGNQAWLSGFGASDHVATSGEAAAIYQADDGNVFVSGFNHHLPTAATWTVFKLTGPFSDDVYANGFEP